MNFFTKTFGSIKSNLTSAVVRSVVSSKLNTLEDKITRSEPLITKVGNTILNIYKYAFEEFNNTAVTVTKEVKTDLTNLVAENYETINQIVNLVKSLDTERNRKIIGSIATIAINHAKTWNTEVQTHFENTMEQNTINASKEFDTIWDLKPSRRKRTDIKPVFNIDDLIDDGYKVMIRQIGSDRNNHNVELWVDSQILDHGTATISHSNILEIDRVIVGDITDIYFYDIALDSKEEIDSRYI